MALITYMAVARLQFRSGEIWGQYGDNACLRCFVEGAELGNLHSLEDFDGDVFD